MTPIVPSSTVLVPTVLAGQPAPTPVAPIPPVAGTILSGGAVVTQLQAGTLLRGTVTGRNEQGQLIVDTPRGRLILAAQANLAPGSEVVLQVRSGGPHPQVMLQQATPEGHAAARQAGGPAHHAAASTTPSGQGATGAATPAPIAQSQVSGFTTTAVVVAARQPLPGQASLAQPAGPAQPQPGATTPPGAAPPAPAGAAPVPTAPLETGTTVGLRINAVLPPGEEPQPGTAQAAMQRGVITVLTTAGHPIVQTQAGLLLLGTKMAAPVGTTVLMELAPGWTEEPAAAATAGARPLSPAPLPNASQPFPALARALAVLHHAGQAVPEALAKHLPQVGGRLAAGLIAAATGGRAANFAALEAVLRPALEQAGHKELADALRQELGRLAGNPGSSAESEWRLTTMPLLDEGQLHQLRLYERNRRGGQGGRQGSDGVGGTRFVVEVEMSQLGPMQLDGLVQPGRLDVMLRSKLPLSPSLRRDISAIYEEARALTGFTGEIGFQQTAVFPVDPSVAAGHAGVVV